MADVTVAQFAEVLKVPVDKLLSQLDEAGIKVSGAEDTISDDAKLELLTHLRRSHGQEEPSGGDAAPRRITLKRKSQSELRLSGAQGRSRTVNVEVRRKRTYIKRDVLEKQAQQEQEELDRVIPVVEAVVADQSAAIQAARFASSETGTDYTEALALAREQRIHLVLAGAAEGWRVLAVARRTERLAELAKMDGAVIADDRAVVGGQRKLQAEGQ